MNGKIDTTQLNTQPERHEFDIATYFAALGKDITFIKPSNIPKYHRPDFIMDGVEWEIKSPQGKSKRTIEQNYRLASLQSSYVIFDLRRIKLAEKQALSQLKKEFYARPKAKRLLIIQKDGTLLDYKK